mgnify:CR=1 FL=1
MPAELHSRFELEKHTLRTYAPLKAWFDRMILEHKNRKSIKRARGLHELEERRDEEKDNDDEEIPGYDLSDLT